MNTSRRNFFKNLLVAGAAFTVLPSAGRIWKATAKIQPVRAIINPAWINAPYEVAFITSEYAFESLDLKRPKIVPAVFDRRKNSEFLANYSCIKDRFPIRYDINGDVVSPEIIV